MKRSYKNRQRSSENLHKPGGNPNYGDGPGTGFHSGHSFERVQTKLRVNRTDDKYEKEADRMADLVVGPAGIQRSGLRGDKQPGLNTSLESQINNSRGSGIKMPEGTRSFMEKRFGADFNFVRIHDNTQSALLNNSLNSRAFTIGNDIFFNRGFYNPFQAEGKRLLAHELTHVVQQKGSGERSGISRSAGLSRLDSDRIQGSFFGDLWEGIKSVGRSIGNAVSSAVEWVGDRLHDAAMWVVNLFRDLPQRLVRLGETIFDGLKGIVSFIPEAINALATGGIRGFGNWLWDKAKAGGAWVLRLVSRVFDVVGGPEIIEFITHLLSKASPLTSAESNAAKSVLGPNAIRWNDVRVAEGGLMSIIFYFNKARAFATFHTINLPNRSDMPVVVHELTHVYQYEKLGTLYLGQAVMAQNTAVGYNYGGPAGLVNHKNAGKHYRDFNREQQAQIAEDYYRLLVSGGDTSAYDPFIAELRAGDI